jgi:hypothetical protein
MTNARIERLTREALGPARRETHIRMDDGVVHAIGVVILVITVITFATWPRDEAGVQAHAAVANTEAKVVVPASHRSAGDNAADASKREYSPLY